LVDSWSDTKIVFEEPSPGSKDRGQLACTFHFKLQTPASSSALVQRSSTSLAPDR
jgi:hypothetical protein